MQRRVAFVALFLVGLTLSGPVAAQDPWSRVPPAPTGCYSTGDPFTAQVEKARDDLSALITRQKEVNTAAQAKLDEIDAMAKQQRMMTFLQKDPAKAQKYMQDVAAMGTKEQELINTLAAGKAELEKELAAADTKFKAEQEPLNALLQQARGTAEQSPDRARPIFAQYNQGYEKLCARWFSPGSPYLTHLANLKKSQVETTIPLGEEVARLHLVHFEIFAVPRAGYQSTARLEAVHEYLTAYARVYDKRRAEPAKL
jgi:hypothetical protein